jgi:hypothetical protein
VIATAGFPMDHVLRIQPHTNRFIDQDISALFQSYRAMIGSGPLLKSTFSIIRSRVCVQSGSHSLCYDRRRASIYQRPCTLLKRATARAANGRTTAAKDKETPRRDALRFIRI